MIPAHSNRADTTYPSWEDLLAAEANGFAVVSILETTSQKGRTRTFVRTVGPFADRKKAQNKAAALRRRWKKLLADRQDPVLLRVVVEPLWDELL